jgi:hypothetical protein
MRVVMHVRFFIFGFAVLYLRETQHKFQYLKDQIRVLK